MSELPVAIIGAGPQGLAAAAHLRERGVPAVVLERGATAAASVAEWGHVRLFSSWPELIDPAAARLLESTGWHAAESGYPTGEDWIAGYLQPLADALSPVVRLRSEVTGVSRRGRGRLVSAGRGEQPFSVHVTRADGSEYRIEACAVIDASGTWTRPNPAGADGLPALGERQASGHMSYTIQDLADARRFAGRHTVIIGSGHSALTAISQLAPLAQKHPGTRITWAVRRGAAAGAFGGGQADQLTERGALGIRAKQSVDHGLVEVASGFRVERIDAVDGAVEVVAEDGRSLPAADHVVVLTGFRPDLSILSELRLDLDAALEAPSRLAVEIDPNLHSCGDVAATGAKDLAHPQEPGLFVVGMKSYGRAPTFLAMIGYEQVRSVAAYLSGDLEAAARVELALPDTGVCGGAGLFDDPGGSAAGGCCAAPAPVAVTLGGLRVRV